MTEQSIRRFIVDRLLDEARLAQHVAAEWAHEHPSSKHHVPVSTFINRYDPTAAMRAIEVARDVIDRHRPPTDEEQHLHYETAPTSACVGCRDYDDDMGGLQWNIEDINECPELRSLAWRWNHLPGWNPQWCLHLNTKDVLTTTFEDLDRNVRTFITVCRRCDSQIGDVQEEPHYTVRPDA